MERQSVRVLLSRINTLRAHQTSKEQPEIDHKLSTFSFSPDVELPRLQNLPLPTETASKSYFKEPYPQGHAQAFNLLSTTRRKKKKPCSQLETSMKLKDGNLDELGIGKKKLCGRSGISSSTGKKPSKSIRQTIGGESPKECPTKPETARMPNPFSTLQSSNDRRRAFKSELVSLKGLTTQWRKNRKQSDICGWDINSPLPI